MLYPRAAILYDDMITTSTTTTTTTATTTNHNNNNNDTDHTPSMRLRLLRVSLADIYIYIYMNNNNNHHQIIHNRFPKFHRVFLGRDPGTQKSDIVSKKTSTINLFGVETLKLKFRRLKSWKPTACY